MHALCPCLRGRRRDYQTIAPSYGPPRAFAATAAALPQRPPQGGGAAIAVNSSSGSGGSGGGSNSGGQQSAVSPTLPGAVGLPDWVSDEVVAKCYGCAAAFDVIHRRHHCRRCRNVFCSSCSATERPVLLVGLREPARVCMRCSSEVVRENHFLDAYLAPLLEGGEMALTTRGLIMMSRRVPVRLLLAPSLDRLEIREAAVAVAVVAPGADSSAPPPAIARIPLAAISGVSEEGALGLLILTDGGNGGNGKQHRLECAGPSQRALFTGAIREAAKAVPLMVAFKARVEAEREQRALQEQLALSDRLRREEALARRQEKQGFRDSIAQKYGLAGKR